MLPAVKPRTVAVAGISLAAVLGCTGLAFSLALNLASAGFLYLVLIVLSALYGGFWVATVSSIAAVTCLTYFFVPPVFSFSVNHPENWVALGAFEFTALTISRLSHRAQARAAEAIAERRDTGRLYEASRRILALERSRETAARIPPMICELFALSGAALFDPSSGSIHKSGATPPDIEDWLRSACALNTDRYNPSTATRFCVLRLSSRAVGALALTGAGLRPIVASAIASLAAVAVESARSFDLQCHAEAARQSEQLRTAVLEALAHEFKTPLTIIRTVSSGLLAVGGLSETNTELVTLIDEQSTKLNDLASRLLSARTLEGAEFQPQLESLLVSDLITAAIDMVCPRNSRGRFQFTAPGKETPVLADRNLMATALGQLVDNAVKYSDAGSPIGVAVMAGAEEVRVTVESQGSPIPPADRERVFDRFYRIAGPSGSSSGTGLGLSIVKRIVDAHHGRVWAESSPGGRSVFSIVLPAPSGQP